MISRVIGCIMAVIAVTAVHEIKAQSIVVLQQGQPTSIRGLSVVDDSVAWVSGSKGTIGITADGGKTWQWQVVKGYEKADFRDIEAFSNKEAIIMASGTPALILKTSDGGANWQLVYSNNNEAYFLDAMDFDGTKHGWVLGDPIDGKFLLLETKDAGHTWAERKDIAPAALKDEAAFAASGTCLRAAGNKVFIVTGGSSSRLLTITNKKQQVLQLPLKQGQPSQGAFSIAVNKNHYVVTGGDYANDKSIELITCIVSKNSAFTATKEPAGFQSAVEYIGGAYLSTGTPGSSISTDDGKNWVQIGTDSFNVCRKAKNGKLVLFAGNNGKIAVLK